METPLDKKKENNKSRKSAYLIGGLAGTGAILGHKYLHGKKNPNSDFDSTLAATHSAVSRAIDRRVNDEFKGYGEDLKNRFLKEKGLDTEVGRFNKVFEVDSPKELENTLKGYKDHKIYLPKSSYLPGALGIGTAAALGSYYAANRDKRWRGEDGKIDKRKMSKDLGKAGLAGAGMYAAGKLTEGVVGGNTLGKLRKIEGGFDLNDDGTIPHGKFIHDYGNALKKHHRNVKIGMAGLAAGAGGYALYKYLKRRKREKEEKDKNNK